MGREPGKDARLPIAPSRTRRRRQDAADAAQSPAARRAAKNKPNHRPDLHSGSRQDAGVDWRIRLPYASRRTRRRCANLNADTDTSARGREHVRVKGAGHGCPAPASRRMRRRRAIPTSKSVRPRTRPNGGSAGMDTGGAVSARRAVRSAQERQTDQRRWMYSPPRTRASVGPEGRTERPGRQPDQRRRMTPARTRASVGPEGRTERSRKPSCRRGCRLRPASQYPRSGLEDHEAA